MVDTQAFIARVRDAAEPQIPNSMDIRDIDGEVDPAVAHWFNKPLIVTVDGVAEARPVQAYDIAGGWLRVSTDAGGIETIYGVVEVKRGLPKPDHNPTRTVRMPLPPAPKPKVKKDRTIWCGPAMSSFIAGFIGAMFW
jgi:hypothetical protein